MTMRLNSVDAAALATSYPSQVHLSSQRHRCIRLLVFRTIFELKAPSAPWTNVPLHHPLVPLGSLDRVKDKQQICVAAQIAENPGSMERDTVNGRMLVCNAIIQQGGTKVRCAFWRDHAEKLAGFPTGTCLLLYQVLAEKKKRGILGSRKLARDPDSGVSRPLLLDPCERHLAVPRLLSLLSAHWSANSDTAPPQQFALYGAHSCKATVLSWSRPTSAAPCSGLVCAFACALAIAARGC